MSLEFTMGSGGLPVGSYRAEFVGTEPYEENVEKYGPGVLLRFRVMNGPEVGNETSRICSAKLTPKTALGKLAVAIKGGAIESGERFSFDGFAGAKGSVIVEPTDNGGTRVGAFIRDANGQG